MSAGNLDGDLDPAGETSIEHDPAADGLDLLTVLEARARVTSVEVREDDFFAADWSATLRDLPDPLLVIGNPPWVRIHQIAESSKERLREEFEVYRNAAWEVGAAAELVLARVA